MHTFETFTDSEESWEYARVQENPRVPIIITKKRIGRRTGKEEFELGMSGIWFTERNGVYERVTDNSGRARENESPARTSESEIKSRMSTSDQTALSSKKPSCMGEQSDKT